MWGLTQDLYSPYTPLRYSRSEYWYEAKISVLEHILATRCEWMKTISPAEQNMLYYTHLSLISGITSRVTQGGYGEYITWGSPVWQQVSKRAKTNTVFFPISEVCRGIVSLMLLYMHISSSIFYWFDYCVRVIHCTNAYMPICFNIHSCNHHFAKANVLYL